MTRKDFEAIASAIRTAVGVDSAWTDAAESIASELADYLATTNPRFDRARFLKACGVIGS